MNFTNNPPNQIQFSTWQSLLISLLSIIFLLCQHCLASTNLYNQTDRFALLKFKHQIADDPHNFFDSWNDSLHFCQWRGVTCGLRHKRVISLDISGQDILGTISPHIGNLSFLRFINLKHNSFHGKIPQQIGQLFRLRILMLSDNNLHGQLPTNLSCVHLRKLVLNKNWLVGAIPVELGSLMMLETLNLGSNNFSGFIPQFFEYGMGGEASKYGDIYSYGVLLLEMMTGRRPTDAMFKDGLSLYNYARAALEQEDVLMIVDSALVANAENGATAAEEEYEYGDEVVVEQNNRSMENVQSENSKLEKCISGVVEIGVRCSEESPKERMSMNEVLRELHRIRTAFLVN